MNRHEGLLELLDRKKKERLTEHLTWREKDIIETMIRAGIFLLVFLVALSCLAGTIIGIVGSL